MDEQPAEVSRDLPTLPTPSPISETLWQAIKSAIVPINVARGQTLTHDTGVDLVTAFIKV